jgi:transcriptional regulator with XRE-family HTH domain
MPAKPLSAEQLEDAARLRALFSKWQDRQRKSLQPGSQEAAAQLLGFNQSALSQYLSGRIPLNTPVLAKLCALLETTPDSISPSLAEQQRHLGALLSMEPAPRDYVQPQSLAPEIQQLLSDLGCLLPARRSEILDLVHQEANHVREVLAHHNRRHSTTTTPTAAAKRPGHSKASTVIRHGDGNPRQGKLPLTIVPDPFTAQPDQRELALYERIEAAQKHPR